MDNQALTFGSLFTGIGGFDLGFERAGMVCKWQVEIDNYCNKVLEKHWSGIKRYRDIRKCGKYNLDKVDVIIGGFPCPAFSIAGKRGGFQQDDLFFEMLRVCNEISPDWVVFENVQGFVKWRKEAINEIKNIGYDIVDVILDARDFGIPQSRRRWFGICFRQGNSINPQLLQRVQGIESKGLYGVRSYVENTKRGWTHTIQTKDKWRAICSNAKRMRIDNGVSNRMDRLRCLGNAVVPQVAEFVAKGILQIDQKIKRNENIYRFDND